MFRIFSAAGFGLRRRPQPPDDQLLDVLEAEIGDVGLVDDRDRDAPLKALFEHETADSRLIVNVVDRNRKVIAVRSQFADFEPNHQIVFTGGEIEIEIDLFGKGIQ